MGLIDISPLAGPVPGWRISGELDLSTGPELESAIRSAETTPVVLDMSGVSFMDSSGLRVILSMATSLDGHGPSIILRNPTRPVRRVLGISVPDGFPGLEVQFDGAGPGAAHRFSELMRSTSELRTSTMSAWAHAAAARSTAASLLVQRNSLRRRPHDCLSEYHVPERR